MLEDTLAQSLASAAADPANKPAFARTLMASTVYVMGQIEGEDPSRRSNVELKAGTSMILQSHRTPEGKTIVPFFSSLEKLRAFIKSQVNYLAIPARTLFEVAKGSTLVLNPGSPVFGEISPEDAAKLMVQGGGPR